MSLTMRGASYAYAGTSKPVLEGIDLEVEPGRLVAIVGPNESGKSTLCLVAAGLAPAAIGGRLSGSVVLGGAETATLKPHEAAQRCGILFQNPATQLSGTSATVWEELAFGPAQPGVAGRRSRGAGGSGDGDAADPRPRRARPASAVGRAGPARRPRVGRRPPADDVRPRRTDEPARSGRHPPRRRRARPARRGRHGGAPRGAQDGARRAGRRRGRAARRWARGVRRAGRDRPRGSAAWRARRRSAAEREDCHGAGRRRPRGSTRRHRPAALESEPVAADSLAGSR